MSSGEDKGDLRARLQVLHDDMQLMNTLGRMHHPNMVDCRHIEKWVAYLLAVLTEPPAQTGGCSRTPNTCTSPFCGYPDCLMGSPTP